MNRWILRKQCTTVKQQCYHLRDDLGSCSDEGAGFYYDTSVILHIPQPGTGLNLIEGGRPLATTTMTGGVLVEKIVMMMMMINLQGVPP